MAPSQDRRELKGGSRCWNFKIGVRVGVRVWGIGMEAGREGMRWLRNAIQFTPQLGKGIDFLRKRTELEIKRFPF